MTLPETAAPQQPPLRFLADQTKTACEISDKHRAYLVERIAQLRAWADAKQAEAEVLKRHGADSSAAMAECERHNAQALMLNQRVAQLLLEMYGPMTGIQPQAVERKPWQRPEWWAQLETACQGIEKIAELATVHAHAIGPVCQQEITVALVGARRAIESKPADVRSAQVEPLPVLCLVAEKLAPVPWHLLDVDPQNGAQLVLLLRYLCQGMPEDAKPGAAALRAECLRQFDLLIEAMKDHKETGRVEAARQHFAEENQSLAASILSGIAPPDQLRYEVSRLVNMITQ